MIIALAALAVAQTPDEGVTLTYQETIPFPADFDGERPSWQTNRFGQVLLLDRDKEVFAVDQAGRALRPLTTTEEATPYRFPLSYFERWSPTWRVVRGGRDVSLADGPDFTGAAQVSRWGDDRREALLRIERAGIEVYTVSPPSSHRDFPTCTVSVPETCLASGITLLREYAGDPKATSVAKAQIERACSDGVVRACFIGVSLEDGRNSAAARSCLSGDAEACATVAGATYAEAKMTGSSSKAGERMLEYACNEGVAGACSEAAEIFDERDLPHNALLMLDRACVSGDRAACDDVELRRDRAFATGIAKACLRDEPDPIGCITLAQFLEEKPQEGLGIDAFEAWSRACSGGEEPACRAMGPYVDRWGMDDPRVQTATTALLGSCDQGSTGACVGAAHLLVRLDTRDERYGKARSLYSKACDAGDVQGCLAGAAVPWSGTAKRLDLPGPEALTRKACEAGSVSGCADLGVLLAGTRGRTDEAIPVLDDACDKGASRACTQLGLLALAGRHATELDPQAIFGKGCDDDEAEACFQVGELASKGVAPLGSPAHAAYDKACRLGQLDACEATGRSHLARGTHYEATLAAAQFEKACDGGRMNACSELGALYKQGKGVVRDRRQGRELLVRAGDLEPIKHLRLGVRLGFLNLLGADTELVLPLPVGPAISVGGEFSYLPGTDGLSMTYLGPTVRVYPKHSGRGLYAAAGWHQFRIDANGEITKNTGFNGRVGVRLQKGITFGGVEIGLASVDAPRVQEIIRPIPLVVPVFGVSGGLAVF